MAASFTSNPAYAPQFDVAKSWIYSFYDIDSAENVMIRARYPDGYTYNNNFAPSDTIIFNPLATHNAETDAASLGVNGCLAATAGQYGCVGTGLPGAIVALLPGEDSSRPNCRFCTWKDAVLTTGKGWADVQTGLWDSSNAPTIAMVNGTADGSTNVFDVSSMINCPANSLGAPVGVKQCSQITISGEPTQPGGVAGARGTIQPGDRFALSKWTYNLDYNPDHEQVMVLSRRSSATVGAIVLVVQRDVYNVTAEPYGWPKLYGSNTLDVSGNPVGDPQTLPTFTMRCNSGVPGNYFGASKYAWNFVADPHAINAGGTTILGDKYSSVGHAAADALGNYVQIGAQSGYGGGDTPLHVGACRFSLCGVQVYSTRTATPNQGFDAVLNQPNSYQSSIPGFANQPLPGAITQSHPGSFGSATLAYDKNYAGMYMDGRPSRGGGASGLTYGESEGVTTYPNQPGTNYGGDLWVFTSASMGVSMPYSKFYPLQGYSGMKPLLNISSAATGNAIGTGPADNYKFCIAAVNGECRSDGVAGYTYANVPHITTLTAGCTSASQAYTQMYYPDICIGGTSTTQNGMTQTLMDVSSFDGSTTRTLMRVGEKANNVFLSPFNTSDNKFSILEYQLPPGGQAKTYLLATIPPRCLGGITSPCLATDGVSRTNFIPRGIAVPQRANSTAYVRFGYQENNLHPEQAGTDAALLNPTTRKEIGATAATSSWAASENWTSRQPYYMETTEASSLAGVDVSSASATIYLPGLPQHAIFYQVAYKDKTSSTLTLMPLAITMAP